MPFKNANVFAWFVKNETQLEATWEKWKKKKKKGVDNVNVQRIG